MMSRWTRRDTCEQIVNNNQQCWTHVHIWYVCIVLFELDVTP